MTEIDVEKIFKKFNKKVKECAKCQESPICPKQELELLANSLIHMGMERNVVHSILIKYFMPTPTDEGKKHPDFEYI